MPVQENGYLIVYFMVLKTVPNETSQTGEAAEHSLTGTLKLLLPDGNIPAQHKLK